MRPQLQTTKVSKGHLQGATQGVLGHWGGMDAVLRGGVDEKRAWPCGRGESGRDRQPSDDGPRNRTTRTLFAADTAL
ncbi:MAG: hypothetical protein VX893_01745 [Candidatus Latescibacterota bacterium]|nr:hypothetical protein [Candidatus Latescibacterota bacterium]